VRTAAAHGQINEVQFSGKHLSKKGYYEKEKWLFDNQKIDYLNWKS